MADLLHTFAAPPVWEAIPRIILPYSSWYPTSVTDHRGWGYVVGGVRSPGDPRLTYENRHKFFNPLTKTFHSLPAGSERELDEYPFMYQIPIPITVGNAIFPAGSFFCAGPRNNTALLKVTPDSALWSVGINRSQILRHASSVMFLPGQVMKCGGYVSPAQATGLTEVIDLTKNNPTWRTPPHELPKKGSCFGNWC